jgi:hypothetical protein
MIYCGDGQANSSDEQCDGEDLRGASCASLLGAGVEGNLKCKDCVYDISECSPLPSNCGNGIREEDEWEECDGTDLGWESCSSYQGGLSVGTLRCNYNCTFNDMMCYPASMGPTCGDGIWFDFREECDGGGRCNDSCEFRCKPGELRWGEFCYRFSWTWESEKRFLPLSQALSACDMDSDLGFSEEWREPESQEERDFILQVLQTEQACGEASVRLFNDNGSEYECRMLNAQGDEVPVPCGEPRPYVCRYIPSRPEFIGDF